MHGKKGYREGKIVKRKGEIWKYLCEKYENEYRTFFPLCFPLLKTTWVLGGQISTGMGKSLSHWWKSGKVLCSLWKYTSHTLYLTLHAAHQHKCRYFAFVYFLILLMAALIQWRGMSLLHCWYWNESVAICKPNTLTIHIFWVSTTILCFSFKLCTQCTLTAIW